MLDNKRILVTGAAIGIGRAIAVELARQGANVALADIRPPEETLAIIMRAKGHAFALQFPSTFSMPRAGLPAARRRQLTCTGMSA